ncbi:MAG TPA: hypothetical protein VE944_32915 [Nostoc sp.]|uniref:hypothetical protein n=1 Tax=Nostoc sp. TaxID=1180 RepID=UPI002D354F97|nr:hypothetical protein [Nostoc sp.]HYX19071.1 hypothetical protein [Nostoc sp.]
MADTCASLAAEIAALRAEIARIPKVDENRIINATKSALQPDIAYAVAAGGVVVAQKLKPQIEDALQKSTNAFLEVVRNTERIRLAEIEAKGASATATRAEKNAAEYARQMREEQARITRVEGEAVRLGRENKQLQISDEELYTANRQLDTESRRLAQLERKNAGKIQQIEAEIPPIKSNVETVKTDVKNAVSKATDAVADAAKASKQVLDVASDVTGVKGAINGVKGTLGKLGDTVVAVEKKAGDAITAAAKAVGISSEALGATARLGGKVLEIFNVIGTIFTILDGIASRELLGARMDAVEAGLAALGRDVSSILGRLFQVVNQIKGFNGAIDAVRALANEAKGLSASATSLAQSALGNASTAQSTAVAAQSTAVAAQSAASMARVTALESQTVAGNAIKNAATAQGTALEAQRQAATATATATKTKTLAEQALQKGGEALTKVLEIGATVLTIVALVQGIKALRGIPGPRGIPGQRGERGFMGFPGLRGRDGVTTVVTLPGIPGKPGDRGFPGLSGKNGRDGRNGINGKDGVDAVPYNDSGLRAFIAAQHTGTRANSNVQHGTTRTTILTPILAAFAPVLALLKQIYDIVSKASAAAQLALLNIINNKLGNQVLGGIGGLITRVAENSYVEKALSVLTFAATMHNALMLSNNLAQTLGTIIDQVLGFVLPKGIDGTPISINQVIGKAVTEIITSAIGEANYKQISEDWAKANRIYQAGANVFNQIGNAVGLVTAGLEVIAGNVGKIGNALKVWGVVSEKAYGWMNPQPNLKGRFFNFINTASEKANTIAMMVAIPVGISIAAVEINSSVEAVKKELDQEDPKDKQGNPVVDKLGNVVKYQPGVTVPEPTVTTKANVEAKADSTNFLELVLEDIFDGGD